MFKPTYLYVKSHNVTKLKYFGKTTSSDPHRYRGSGKYWKRHILKHGYDVTTEVLGIYTDKEECSAAAIRFSKQHNIVESLAWANFKIENGLDGGFSHLNDGSVEHRARASEAARECHRKHPQLARTNLAKSRTPATAKKSADSKKEKYGDGYFSAIASYEKTAVHKLNISKIAKEKGFGKCNKGKAKPKVKCPHCEVCGAIHVMSRFHFDNCKKRVPQALK